MYLPRITNVCTVAQRAAVGSRGSKLARKNTFEAYQFPAHHRLPIYSTISPSNYHHPTPFHQGSQAKPLRPRQGKLGWESQFVASAPMGSHSGRTMGFLSRTLRTSSSTNLDHKSLAFLVTAILSMPLSPPPLTILSLLPQPSPLPSPPVRPLPPLPPQPAPQKQSTPSQKKNFSHTSGPQQPDKPTPRTTYHS